MNMPVKISWDRLTISRDGADGYWIGAEMPTNRPDLALKFVYCTDEKGNKIVNTLGGGSQHRFRQEIHQAGRTFTMVGKPTTMTFAVVPNIRVTLYAQPRLADERAK